MASVYLHIPFCRSRCLYCDFYSTTLLGRRSDYIDALLAEIDARRTEIGTVIPTVYFGGGTPSLIAPEDIARILSSLFPDGNTGGAELTLEANPGDITPDLAKTWRRIGINRLSIGIQSFDDGLLHLIGRRHSSAEALEAVRIVREARFDNLSVDLIYGLPGQTASMWESDIDRALSLRPEHISCYCLSYEDSTPLTRMLDRGEIHAVDDDTENAFFDRLCIRLLLAGYEHYEVSNFALPGRRSRHNSRYWDHSPYVGLGAAAHSLTLLSANGTPVSHAQDAIQYVRSWNVADIDSYISAGLARSLQRESEALDAEAIRTERIMLGLRTSEGVLLPLVTEGLSPAEAEAKCHTVYRLVEQGLLLMANTRSGARLTATQRGFHILNRIIQDLI